MRNLTPVFFILLLAGLSSCQPEAELPADSPRERVSRFADLNVPSGFDWEMSEERKYIVSLGQNAPHQGKYLLEWFSEFPHARANAEHAVFLDASDPFVGDVRTPRGPSEVYLKLTAPDGVAVIKKLPSQSVVSHTFFTGKWAGTSGKTSTYTCPDCSTGCDETLSNVGSKTFECPGGGFFGKSEGGAAEGGEGCSKVFCVTGAQSGSHNWTLKNDVTVRVCTAVDLSDLEFRDNATLIITSTGSVSITGSSVNNSMMSSSYPTMTICSGGSFNYNSSVRLRLIGTVNNYGSLNVNSQSAFSYFGEFNNNGTATIEGVQCESTPFFTSKKNWVNNNLITFRNCNLKFNVSNGAEFTNNCTVVSEGSDKQIFIRGEVTNNSYIEVEGLLKVDDGKGTLNLSDQSLFVAEKVEIDPAGWSSAGKIIGPSTAGEVGVLKITGTNSGDVTGGGDVEGNVDITTTEGTASWNLANTVTTNAGTYIAPGGCFLEGNGSGPIIDCDGDGVADEIDAFVCDSSKAYIDTAQFVFLAEDLYPSIGDYDMNDLVVEYTIETIKNGKNRIQSQKVTVTTKAMGASNDIGFGFHSENTAPGHVGNATGCTNYSLPGDGAMNVSLSPNGTESGQDYATLIVYNSIDQHWPDQDGFSFINVRNDGSSTQAFKVDTVRIEYVATNGRKPESVIWNPFIFVNDRSKEIHLAGKHYTGKYDIDLIGSSQDAGVQRDVSTYFKTASGLPWALRVEGPYQTVLEKQDITTAYKKFQTWAESGGLTDTDWNIGDGSAYQEDDKFYTR